VAAFSLGNNFSLANYYYYYLALIIILEEGGEKASKCKKP
jgi:hypothetical protein